MQEQRRMNGKSTAAVPHTGVAALFIISAALVTTFFIPWERALLETLQPLGDTTAGSYFVLAAKYAGNGFYQAIFICLILLHATKVLEDRKLAESMRFSLYAVILSGVAANILKFSIGKARPGEKLGNWHIEPFSAANDFHSFPSGHTATSFALAYVIAAFYPRLALPAFSAALLIGAGRIVGESHFPSDVMAGALLGMACGWTVMRWGQRKNRKDQHPEGQTS